MRDKRKIPQNILNYTLLGIIFGATFPLFSQFMDILVFHNMSYNIENIVKIHDMNPMHYVIDSAPIFLGLAFYIAGKHLEKYDQLNGILKERVREQTGQLQKQNTELQLKYQEILASEEELRQSQRELMITNTQLNDYKKELEIRVEERTKELATNVDQLEQATKQLIIAKEEAENANQSKSQFLANMSHEIRSPLNAIIGFTQIMELRSRKGEIGEEALHSLDKIKVSGQNLLEIINNILDLSKIEAGKMELDEENINIKQLFVNIFQINKSRADSEQVKFSYSIADDLPDYIKADRTKLNQILMNLVSNALKFTPKDKEVRISVSLNDENYIAFEVEDEGIGIAKDKIEKIFDPFEQADNTITRRYGGTGLGLAITKKMIKLMGGNINVQSSEGEGTTFTATIPNREVVVMEQIITKDLQYIEVSKDKNVVIVEDNLFNQEVMTELFEELNINAHIANNGEEAIKMCMDINPNLVLMDVHMPVLDGIEATKAIRNIKSLKHIPIVGLSADAFEQSKINAIKVGMNDYLTKPIQFTDLMPVLEKYLVD